MEEQELNRKIVAAGLGNIDPPGEVELPTHKSNLKTVLASVAEDSSFKRRGAVHFPQVSFTWSQAFTFRTVAVYMSHKPSWIAAFVAVSTIFVAVLTVSVSVLANHWYQVQNANLKITEITGLTQPPWAGITATGSKGTNNGAQTGLDFLGIKQVMGALWVPQFLPQGWEIVQTMASPDYMIVLTYNKPGSHGSLVLTEFWKPAELTYPSGNVKEVVVGNAPGYFVYGGWAVIVNSPEQPNATTWKKDNSLNLIFEFEGHNIQLSSTPSGSLTEEELLSIALSLQAY